MANLGPSQSLLTKPDEQWLHRWPRERAKRARGARDESRATSHCVSSPSSLASRESPRTLCLYLTARSTLTSKGIARS